MATATNDNFDDLCRICATKTSVVVGINIFEREGNIREINKKINTCLPIQIHEEDQLPKMICRDCIYNLDLVYNFREKSLRAETYLVELIKKLNEATIKTNKMPEKITNHINITLSNQEMPTLENEAMIRQNNGINIHIPNEELLDQTSQLHLRENDIILNSQNLNINGLDNIQITHELPNDDISNVITQQTLNLEHATNIGDLVEEEINIQHSQLTVQNLELIHTQHNLMEFQDIKDEENKLISLKNEDDIMDIKVEQGENISYKRSTPEDDETSDSSTSEDSSDLDFEPHLESAAGEVIKNYDSNENHFYFEEQSYEQAKDDLKDHFMNSNDIGTTISADGTQWYYCNICGKTMSDNDALLRHYEDHIFKCMACEVEFQDLEQLNTHRQQLHPKKTHLGNDKAPKVSKTRTRLKPAVKEDSNSDSIKREFSDNEAGEAETEAENGIHNEEEQEEEIEKTTKKKRWEAKVCKECGKIYKTNYKLAEHMRKHTGEQPYKCTTCDKAFRSKIGLAQHEAKHTGQYDYSCPTCGKGFQCRSYLIVHQRVHSDLKPYPCTTCGSNFKTKQSLLDHMNRHLGVKPYLCEICGRGFITKGLWKSHQKVHTGLDNRQYPCTVCNKMFVSKSYLATHVRIHTGEKPFMCEVCGKGFLTRVDLRIHSTMHTGEKSFVCETCGKAFARRDALRCHRRSHTGERPYKCDVCGQTFTQFSPMAIHKRLHTGERPYSCEVCSKTFVSRSTMMSHRKKHVP